jgi:catalase
MPLTTDEKLLALSRETIAVFDKANGGVHPGFRPAHAKGILLTGTFTPSAEAGSLTRAPHLQRSSTPVTVRFSDFAGIPTVADNDPQGAGPRGFAVRFHLGEHIHTDIIGHSVDNFPVRTAEGLVEFLSAVIATDPKGPHPNAIEQFLGTHPAAMRFVQIPKPVPTSFATESFFRGIGLQVYQRGRCEPLRALPGIAGRRQQLSWRDRSGRPQCKLSLRRDQRARCKGARQVSRCRAIGRGRRHE